MELLSELGKRIKLIRVYSGIKQKNLALDLDVPASLLSMYEQGKREPSLTFLHSFCNRFDMTLSQLFIFQNTNSESNANKDFKNIMSELNSVLRDFERDKLKLIDA